MKIFQIIFTILLIFHIWTWVWLFIGERLAQGWISFYEIDSKSNSYFSIYIQSLFFITTTFSSVGYGNMVPHENTEIAFVMILELIGVTIFSFIMGTLFSLRRQKSHYDVLSEKQANIERFLNDVSNAHLNILPSEIIKLAQRSLEFSHYYDIKSIFDENQFYFELKPKLQKKLIDHVLLK